MHTDFQIDHFIISKGNWTAWGKHRQAIREIECRERAAVELGEQLEFLVIDRDEIAESKDTGYAAMRNNVKLRQIDRGIEQLRRQISENETELARFRLNNDRAISELGPISNGRAKELEQQTWMIRIRAMAAMDFASEGRVMKPTWRLILSLPTELRRPLVEEIHATMRLIHTPADIPEIPLLEWFTNHLPEIEDASHQDGYLETSPVSA